MRFLFVNVWYTIKAIRGIFSGSMNEASYHILRIGLAITFVWIGVMILDAPGAWGGYLQPWAVRFLPVSVSQAMTGAGILDIAIGLALFVRPFARVASWIAAAHVIIVLITSGITDITVRDIAIFTSAIALAIYPRHKEVKVG